MKPLPQWVAILSLIAAVLGALDASVLHFLPTTAGVAIVAAGAVLTYLSQHIVGDGIPAGYGIISLIVAAFGTINALSYPDPACTPTPEHVCGTVRLVTLLPPVWGTVLAAAGAIGAAFSQGAHPATGLVPGTAKITGNG